MGISTSILRLTEYYKRNGFGATVRRAALGARRALFANRMVVFYCDLSTLNPSPMKFPNSLKGERVNTRGELNAEDLQDMTSFWNPKQALRNIEERFAKGASLWLIKSGEKLGGYGWTLQGRTMEPYFFPLGKRDVHLFDFHVFSQYRGRGLNPLLVSHILHSVALEGGCRAFIEAAEWNQAQLSSLGKTPFRQLGLVRIMTIFGHSFVRWAGSGTPQHALSGREGEERTLPVARSHER